VARWFFFQGCDETIARRGSVSMKRGRPRVAERATKASHCGIQAVLEVNKRVFWPRLAS
jgi:hypothetical protein